VAHDIFNKPRPIHLVLKALLILDLQPNSLLALLCHNSQGICLESMPFTDSKTIVSAVQTCLHYC